jgi:pyruvate carboxylase
MSNGEVRSSHAGRVVRVLVWFGKMVEKREELVLLEVDGREVPVISLAPGMVVQVDVDPGDQVKAGDLLAILAV